MMLFVALSGCSCAFNPVAYQRTCELKLNFLPDQVTLSDNQRRQIRDLALTASAEKSELTVTRNGTSPLNKNLMFQIGVEIANNGVLNENILVEHHFDGYAYSEMLFITCKKSI